MSFPRYPEYKDSGVEWLGDIPEHWEVMQSRRMFAVRSEPATPSDRMLTASQKYGVLFQSDFVEREGRRVVEVIMGTENLKHVEPDDFIISMRSFQGGIEWCKLRGSTSFHYVMLKPVKHVHPAYFAHLLKSATYIQALRTTTDLIRDGQELRYSNFVQVDLPLVPMDEQAAIARFLDHETAKIDALVEEQRRLIELLKEKRQAVISQAVMKGLDPNVPMKDSGVEWLGEIPAHWDVAALNFRYEVMLGKMLDEKRVSGDHLAPYLRNVDVQWDRINTDDLPQMDFTGDDFRRYSLVPGDLLVCEGGDVGRAAIWQGEISECFYQKALHRLRRRDITKDKARFMFYILRMATSLGVFEAGGGKSTIAHLTAEALRRYRFAFPPGAEQEKIAAFLDSKTSALAALVAEAESASRLLQERRSALISAAVTGKIDVRGLLPQTEVEAA